MALKYYFEFTDVKGILHRCEIYNDDFVGDSLEINGNLSLNKSSTEDTLEAIRGGGITINLEANNELKFDDFYTENERVFSVKYIRDGIELFYGWLSPEGLVESFVADKWLISLDCTDGLGFLSNLSYVDNEGFPFSGKQSELEIITNCLKRTNLEQNIYTSINIFYSGLSDTLNVLNETYLNANRFIKDDESTYMNCDEVLRSVLEPYGACITQYNGHWYIYKPNELFDSSETTFFAYDNNGLALVEATLTVDFAQLLGSDVNDFYPHHANGNQRLTVDSAIGAYRINYKYGFVKSLFENPFLLDNGSTIVDWIINDATKVTLTNSNSIFVTVDNGVLAMTSKTFNVLENNVLEIINTYQSISNATAFNISVILTDGVTTNYLQRNLTWGTTSVLLIGDVGFEPINNYNITTPPIPFDGNIYIELYCASSPDNAGGSMRIDKIDMRAVAENENINIKGQNHTFQIIDNPSTKIEDTKEVYNGDNPSDIYVGTIYESDETTPTEFWNRKNETRVDIPLLRIMGEERMKMYAKPLRVFSGDIFGFIDYLSVISIDGLTDILFMPIEYDYDALANITTVKLKQILNNNIVDVDQSGILYEFSYDYGNVVKPTIKG